MRNYFGTTQNNFKHIYDLKTISSSGHIEPVQKWVIDTIFNLNKNEYYKLLQETSVEDKEKLKSNNIPNDIIESNVNVPSSWDDVSSPILPSSNSGGWDNISSPILPPNIDEETIENFSDEPAP